MAHLSSLDVALTQEPGRWESEPQKRPLLTSEALTPGSPRHLSWNQTPSGARWHVCYPLGCDYGATQGKGKLLRCRGNGVARGTTRGCSASDGWDRIL